VIDLEIHDFKRYIYHLFTGKHSTERRLTGSLTMPGPVPAPIEAALLPTFRRLVEEGMGLRFPPGQEGDLGHGLERARAALGLAGLPELLAALGQEPGFGCCWRQLAAELTTGESFFFRDQGQMALIRDTLLPDLARRARAGAAVRIWSAGCSRGEEAYSLAILAAGAAPPAVLDRMAILGTDINPQALAAARAGWYCPWSLRGLEPGLRRRWFTAEAGGFRVAPEVRARVVFQEHNLVRALDGDWPGGPGFDLILCRNVLIYFHPDRAGRLLQAFRSALRPDGMLVLGYGEWGPGVPDGLRLEAHPQAMVLRAGPAAAPPVPAAGPEPGRSRDLERDLERLRRLGDAGRGEEALALGRALLHRHPLAPRAHHLLALVLADQGRAGPALACLDRALALDPRFLAARLDQARLREAGGDRVEAARAWAAALDLARALPPGAPLAGLEGQDREDLLAMLQAALRRCGASGAGVPS
jgi:chemotaxis protein methyltransferase CheR